jgi:hypothetical protein
MISRPNNGHCNSRILPMCPIWPSTSQAAKTHRSQAYSYQQQHEAADPTNSHKHPPNLDAITARHAPPPGLQNGADMHGRPHRNPDS